LVWTDSAWQEVECAASFISRDSPRYAAALADEARSAARTLRTSPARGRMLPELNDDSVRELFVKKYRLIYELRSDRVVILAFIHGACQLPLNLR
jgi:plasmid stabilization system protein ParE